MKLATTKVLRKADSNWVQRKFKAVNLKRLELNQYFECVLDKYVGAAHHIVGTCKRRKNCDPQAVVNPELRVYGVRNLRVVDASIMPIIPSANTNAPNIVMGENASDLIKMAHKDYNKATIVSKCGTSFILLWVLLVGKIFF